jgi:hypothetical protein
MKTIVATIFGVTALAAPALAATGTHVPGTALKLPVDESRAAIEVSETATQPVIPGASSKSKAPDAL